MEASLPGRSRAVRPWLRAVLMLIPAALFIALLAVGAANRSGPPAPGDPAPTFRAPLLTGGRSLSLQELEGKPVVLNFWASWCVPCEDEAPILREADRVYDGRVHIVGVNIKDARSDALAFMRKYRLEYPSVRDEGSRIYTDYGLTGQPETFFIDHRGEIIEHVPGATTRENFFQLIDLLVRRNG